MATVPETLTSTKKLFKNTNVAAVGDGLNPALLNSQFFPELGPAKAAFQVPQIGLFDFGKYNFIVQVEERRVIASDTSGELSASSPVPAMLRKFLLESKGVSVSGLGVNFTFEVLLDTSLSDFMVEGFVHPKLVARFGTSFRPNGLKFVLERQDSLVQVTLDPVWGNPTTSLVTVNFHHEKPSLDTITKLVELYGRYVGEVSGLVDKVFGG
ncbi:MAG TPA: hypothetical protein VE263_14395 [Candidatus Angelobacter sp.]|nr:hypothetical protein [Candidatus Angelobacter sp.]